MSDLRTIADGYSFLEGPRWRDDRLYASDFYTGRVVAFDEDGGASTVATVPGQPSGLGFTPGGDLLVVSMTDRAVLRIDDGALVEVADLRGVASWHCNDMLVDPAGRAYVGNFGWDSESDPRIVPADLALVAPDGSVSVAAPGLEFANGMVLSEDGRTLLVAETFAARITAFDVAADGSLSGRRAWATFADGTIRTVPEALACDAPLPDGMALDAEGAVWLGDAAGRGALRVCEGGAIVERIEVPGQAVYALALGGRDRRTLYMCAGPRLMEGDPRVERRARLLACRVDVPGAGLP